MILKFPPTTKELWEQLDEATQKLPQRDRNMFIQDLIKFCLDWQFAYLAMKEAERN